MIKPTAPPKHFTVFGPGLGSGPSWAKFAFTRAKMEDKRRDIAEDAGWIIADLDHAAQAEEGQ